MNTSRDSGIDDVTTRTVPHPGPTSPDEARIQMEPVPPQDILCYIRERDNARTETIRVKAELEEARLKMYDMIKRLEDLESQEGHHHTTRSPCKSAKKKRVPVKADTLPLPAGHLLPPSHRKGSSSARRSPIRTRNPSPSHNRRKTKTSQSSRSKKSVSIENSDPKTRDFYRSIAEKFPTMSIATALNAEEKFKAADINQDGTIDMDELDSVLMANHFLLTPNQLDVILKEIDVDMSKSIDFEEVLTVLDKIERSRKKTLVQADIQEKKSQICVIQ